jgi:Protein of unknown function (DUF3592)
MPILTASRDWLGYALPLVAAFGLATLQRAWTSYRSHRGETWPISYGRILSTTIETQGNTVVLKAPYSYRVGNESYGATFKKEFSDTDEANSWEKALAGKQVPIRYDSSKPSRSRLWESDLLPMVQATAPIAPEEVPALPWWKRSLCQLGLVLAVVGFAACLAQSVSDWMGRSLLNRRAYGLLMAGAIILPLFSFWETSGAGKRTWRAVPEWMKYLGFVVIYFTFFSALSFFPHHSDRRQRGTDRDITYQLAAYFGAIEVFYGRLRSDVQDEDYLQRSLSPGTKIG